MNDIIINLGDLGLIILWSALLVLIFYLVLALKRFNNILKDVKEIISANKENIESTLDEIPSITKNINDITGEVSHDVKAVRDTIDTVAEKSSTAAKSLADTDGIITGITAAIQVFLFAKNLWENIFSKKRRVL